MHNSFTSSGIGFVHYPHIQTCFVFLFAIYFVAYMNYNVPRNCCFYTYVWYVLTDTAMLISELTRFDSFYIFFSTELLVFMLCRQTYKVFQLPWPSFVRVEIYYKYRLSINRKYRLPESWNFHSEVVRALASRPRDHEFESRTIPFFFPYQGLFFLFPCFTFFLNFEVKQGGIYIVSMTIPDLQWKRSQAFLFFKVANTPHNGTIRHIAWLHLSSFLFKIQCFYRDKNNLDPDDQH